MAGNPWGPVQPSAASSVIEKCLAAGVLTQYALDQAQLKAPCFSHVEELQRITEIKSEIKQKSLQLELLRLEKETADIAHPLYLGQKYRALQVMNNHLEAVIREKRSLRQRLAQPVCQENLPIEASYHRFTAELLPLAVNFIEKLEIYINTIQAIPKISDCASNMLSNGWSLTPSKNKCSDNALVRMESLEAEMEELTEKILTWREQQKTAFQMNSDTNSSCITAQTSYLSIENLHA